MTYFDAILTWMDGHPNLSGWAQAFGAMLAIVFAIGVPAYQRHTQILDMRRQRANLNLVLATSTHFLLGDVLNFLEGLITLVELPRASCRRDVEAGDLLERLHALENREISHARIISLYTARGALLLANRMLSNPDFQKMPMSTKEIENLKRDIARVEERYALTQYDADHSIGEARSVENPWPSRPLARVILTGWSFYKHRHLSWKDRIFGTK